MLLGQDGGSLAHTFLWEFHNSPMAAIYRDTMPLNATTTPSLCFLPACPSPTPSPLPFQEYPSTQQTVISTLT